MGSGQSQFTKETTEPMATVANGMRDNNVQVTVIGFKEFRKNTLQGFADLLLPDIGLKIFGATLHEKNGSKWISLPAKPYQENGETKWSAILDFDSKDAREAFQRAALAAVEKYESESR